MFRLGSLLAPRRLRRAGSRSSGRGSGSANCRADGRVPGDLVLGPVAVLRRLSADADHHRLELDLVRVGDGALVADRRGDFLDRASGDLLRLRIRVHDVLPVPDAPLGVLAVEDFPGEDRALFDAAVLHRVDGLDDVGDHVTVGDRIEVTAFAVRDAVNVDVEGNHVGSLLSGGLGRLRSRGLDRANGRLGEEGGESGEALAALEHDPGRHVVPVASGERGLALGVDPARVATVSAGAFAFALGLDRHVLLDQQDGVDLALQQGLGPLVQVDVVAAVGLRLGIIKAADDRVTDQHDSHAALVAQVVQAVENLEPKIVRLDVALAVAAACQLDRLDVRVAADLVPDQLLQGGDAVEHDRLEIMRLSGERGDRLDHALERVQRAKAVEHEVAALAALRLQEHRRRELGGERRLAHLLGPIDQQPGRLIGADLAQ